MNNLKEINIKNRRCYYFDAIIKFEDFNLDNILIDEKAYENILVYNNNGIRTHNHLVRKRTLRLLRAKSPLTFRQTLECRFTLKLVRDMIITYSQFITFCTKV